MSLKNHPQTTDPASFAETPQDPLPVELLLLKSTLKAYFSTCLASQQSVSKRRLIPADAPPRYFDELETSVSEANISALVHLSQFLRTAWTATIRSRLCSACNLAQDPRAENDKPLSHLISTLDSLYHLLADASSAPGAPANSNQLSMMDREIGGLPQHSGLDRIEASDDSALDPLFSQHFFPFLAQFSRLPEYENRQNLWKFPPLYCGIDPLAEIAETRGNSRSSRKTAFLKEMARAAYSNPVRDEEPMPLMNSVQSRQAVYRARMAVLENGQNHVRRCLVCGVESLVVFSINLAGNYTELIDDEIVDSNATGRTVKAECTNCTLQLSSELGNPREYGLDVDDLWYRFSLVP